MERDAILTTVDRIMTRAVRSLDASLPVDQALAVLHDAGFSGAPVVDDGGRVVGVFSALDGLRVLSTAAFHEMPPGTVADHMTRAVRTVRPEQDLFAVAQVLLQGHHRRLPVVDGDGHLVGLVTVGELTEALRRIQAQRDAVKVDRTPAGAAWDPVASEDRDRRGA